MYRIFIYPTFALIISLMAFQSALVRAETSQAEAHSWWERSLDYAANESYGLVGNINFTFQNGDPQNDIDGFSATLGGFWTTGKYIKQWDMSFYAKDSDHGPMRQGETTRLIQSSSITYNVGRYGYWYVANGYAMIGTGLTLRQEIKAECVTEDSYASSDDESIYDCDLSMFFSHGEYKARKTKNQLLPHVRLSAGLGGKFFIEGFGINTYVQIDPVHIQAGIGFYAMLGKLWVL